ncbi:unnamed protein product [Rotaria sp. Silwood2]|nr:unnamed protein product [Rotaria sp. Silwood2]
MNVHRAIIRTGDYGKGNESTSRILGRIHLYSDLIRKGAGSRQEKRRERQSQFDGDTPLAIFYASGTAGQPNAAALTNSKL